MLAQIAAYACLLSLASGPPVAQSGLKLGDAWAATYTQAFLEPGTDEVVEAFTYRVESKVLKATAKGLEIEERTELVESRLGDTAVPPPKGATPLVAKVVIGPNGERALDPTASIEPLEFRLSRPLGFVGPKADPKRSEGRWTAKYPGAEGQAVPGASMTFDFQKRDQRRGRPSTWYAAQFRELGGVKPMSGSGTFVIDEATSLPVEIEMRMANALLPGGDGTRYDVKLTLTSSLP